MKIVIIAIAAAALLGCNRGSASAQTRPPQPQEVQWYQQNAPAQPALAVQQLQVQPPVIHAGQPATVTVKLANVKPGTELTLSWFGPSGWNVADQQAVATGDTLTFQAPADSLTTPGQYHVELRNDVQLLAETPVTVQ